MWARKCLYQLNEREITNCLRAKGSWDLDRNWNTVVNHSTLEFVGIAWQRRLFGICIIKGAFVSVAVTLPLDEHLLKFLNEHVLGIAGLQDLPLKRIQPRQKGQVHAIDGVVE